MDRSGDPQRTRQVSNPSCTTEHNPARLASIQARSLSYEPTWSSWRWVSTVGSPAAARAAQAGTRHRQRPTAWDPDRPRRRRSGRRHPRGRCCRSPRLRGRSPPRRQDRDRDTARGGWPNPAGSARPRGSDEASVRTRSVTRPSSSPAAPGDCRRYPGSCSGFRDPARPPRKRRGFRKPGCFELAQECMHHRRTFRTEGRSSPASPCG